MRFAAVVFFVLGLIAINAAHSSREWQRFKNEHGCRIIPRNGAAPRSYVCNGVSCKEPRDCATLTTTTETTP